MTARTLIVVGNGMASESFCRWMSAEPPSLPLAGNGSADETSKPVQADASGWHVFVLGDEPRPAYDRVHLSDNFDGKTAEDLDLAPRSWYESRGIDLRTQQRIAAIDRDRRVAYDALLLATDSRPFVRSTRARRG